jgi:hypothetical protein
MTLFIADTCDDEILGGGGGSGSNVTSFTYTYATETGTIATDQPATFNAVIPMVNINKTLFVDPVYGDDGTALIGSMSLKYASIDAALAAVVGLSDYTIHLFPGNHLMNNPFTVANVLKIYISSGAKLQTNTGTTSFLVNQAQQLYIFGDGGIERFETLAQHSNPSDQIPCEVYIKGVNIESSGGAPILDVTSMIYSIEYNGIFDSYVDGSGWSSGSISCDLWRTSSYIFRLTDFTLSNGETKYTDYGPQKLTIKGRTKPNCTIINEVQCGNAMYLVQGAEPYKTQINLFCDFESVDGFFVNQGRGIINWHGNLFHSKSDLAGNELPWYYCDQMIENNQKRPVFRHLEGVAVSATHPVYGDSLNNEIFALSSPVIFELYGKYANSGLNPGSGAWPIVYVTNQNGTGEVRLVLGGEFKSRGNDIAPILINDSVVPGNDIRLEVRDCAINTQFDYCIDTNVEMRIYTYHSLVSNKNYNPLISEGLSEDRTMIDSNILLEIPEYGV